MNLTTENAEKYIGVRLWERLPGNHVQQIKVFKFPGGSLGYERIKTGVCSHVPTPQDKANIIDIIKIDTEDINHAEIQRN